MRWTVVEKFTEPKVDGRVNEDLLVTSESFAAVIDGASDETGARFGGRTGGRLAAESLASSISSLSSDATSTEFADYMTARLDA